MKAQAAEVESNEKQRLQVMVDNLNVGAVQIDRTGNPEDPLIFINRSMERLVGYTREEVPTLRRWFQLAHKDEDGSLLEKYEEFMRQVRHHAAGHTGGAGARQPDSQIGSTQCCLTRAPDS